ncbi:MAG TPA: hypothetical protein VJO54_14650 [Burkholderiales bacterium]|nr:hypothetical protein [Burkholderiales bacterium]
MAPPNKRQATVTAAVMVAGALAWIAGIWASGLEGAHGFFGPGPLIADANLILEVFLVAGVSYGFVLARRGNIDAHQVNQTTWVALNLGLIALVMAGSMQDARIARTADLADWRIGVTWLHAAVGSLTALAGLWIVLQMNELLPPGLRVAGWKNLMRAALAGYWLTALLGFATYYFWYIA